MRQIYVAGSYSAPTEEGTRSNIRTALGHAHALTAKGWNCIVPHVMGCHTSTWETAMVRCRDLIRALDPKTDALVALPGLPLSRGAREEVALAESLGVPVLTIFEAMRRTA